MFKNILLGQDSPIPKFKHLKIRCRDGVESSTTLEEGEFNIPIDDCIKQERTNHRLPKVFCNTSTEGGDYHSADFHYKNLRFLWIK